MVTAIVRIVFIPLQQKTDLNHIKNSKKKDFYNVIMSAGGT